MMEGHCIACNKEYPLTKHHIAPNLGQGRSHEFIMICKFCHRMLHHSFNNREITEMTVREQLQFLRNWQAKKEKLRMRLKK